MRLEMLGVPVNRCGTRLADGPNICLVIERQRRSPAVIAGNGPVLSGTLRKVFPLPYDTPRIPRGKRLIHALTKACEETQYKGMFHHPMRALIRPIVSDDRH